MELNDHEKHALSIFQTLVNNNACKERLIDYIVDTEESLGNAQKINWFKIAIQLDSKRLVDAAIENKNIRKQQIGEALCFGAELNKKEKKAKPEYNITLEIDWDEYKNRNFCLNALDYVRERERYLIL